MRRGKVPVAPVDPTAWLINGGLAEFLLLNTYEIKYMCMLGYTFMHGEYYRLCTGMVYGILFIRCNTYYFSDSLILDDWLQVASYMPSWKMRQLHASTSLFLLSSPVLEAARWYQSSLTASLLLFLPMRTQLLS
jgi:hypothetical protein